MRGAWHSGQRRRLRLQLHLRLWLQVRLRLRLCPEGRLRRRPCLPLLWQRRLLLQLRLRSSGLPAAAHRRNTWRNLHGA